MNSIIQYLLIQNQYLLQIISFLFKFIYVLKMFRKKSCNNYFNMIYYYQIYINH